MIAVAVALVALIGLIGWINRGRTETTVSNCEVLSSITDRSARGFGDVRAALLDDGLVVVDGIPQSGDPFRVRAMVMRVEGRDLRVYEYTDEASRRCDSETIGMDGWSVNGTPVEWVGTPHYWFRGRAIVLYLGDDAEFVSLVVHAIGLETRIMNDPVGESQ